MERTSLFHRVPQCWRNADELGLLERYLCVWDKNFWEQQKKIPALMATRNIEATPDKFLSLLVDLVGYRWKNYRSYSWNRDKASQAITNYSYKGTDISIKDLAKEHGASSVEIVDMASKVAVWSRQGTYTEDDDNFYDADFFYPGVVQLFVSEDIDLPHFLEDFEYIKPAATKWYIRIVVIDGVYVSDDMSTGSEPEILLEAGTNFGYNIYTEDFNYFDFVPQDGAEPELIAQG
jgi:hypothetical protein